MVDRDPRTAPDADEIRRRQLVEGLVGPAYAGLYQTNAGFHHAINVLASLLPAMVEGLALDSERREIDRRVLERELMVGLNRPMVMDPGATNVPPDLRRDW